MIELEKIGLKNIIVHKDTQFNFENGITCIRGKNASGKSLLMSSIPNVIDGCPPLAKKKDAKVIHNENSGIALKFKNDSNEYVIKQISKKASISYQISKNGEDITPRTNPMAKELIEKIFPISSDQYYGLVHLTPYRSNILLSGNSTQRKEFFENIFKLNISDYVSEQIRLKLNELKREKEEKEILFNQLSELTFVENLEKLEEDLKNSKEIQQKYQSDYQKKSAIKSKVMTYQTLHEQLYNKELSKEEISTKLIEIQKEIQDLQEEISNLEKQKVEYDTYISTKKMIDSNLEKISKIGKVKESADFYFNKYSEIAEEGKNLSSEKDLKLKEIDLKILEAEKSNKQFQRKEDLEKLIPEKLKLMTLEDFQKKCRKASGVIEANNRILKGLKSLEGESVCPTCHQSINSDDLKTLIEKLSEENSKYSKILKFEDLVLDYKGLPDNLEFINIEDLKKSKNQVIESFDEKLSSLREKITEVKINLEKAKQIQILIKTNENLNKNLKVCSEVDFNLLSDKKVQLNELKENSYSLKQDLEIHKKLDNIDVEGIDIDKINSELNELTFELNSINEFTSNLSSKIALGKEQNAQILKRQKRINEINKDMEDLPIYEALTKAYSAKGIRVAQIKYLADLFCENLNKFKNLVFNKEIKFYVNVDSTNFNILAERNGYPPSDVCMLSGSESRCFMLLSLLSLLPFIPSSLRTDYVVLDEIEAGISEENRKLISQNFFKILQTIIPKVIVVTPMNQQEFYIESDHEYFIHLENNESVMESRK